MEFKLINLLLSLILINVCTCSENEKGGTGTKSPAAERSEGLTPGEKEIKKKAAEKPKLTDGIKNFYRKCTFDENTAALRGQELYEEGKYQDALALFNIAIKKGTGISPSNFISRAKCYLKLDQRNEAMQDFNLVAVLDYSASTKKQCLVIRALLDFKELSEVPIKEMCHTIKQYALVQVAYEMCSQEQQYETALRLYAEAFLEGEYLEYYLSRAICHYKMGKLEDARSDFNKTSLANSRYLRNPPPPVTRRELGLEEQCRTTLEAWANSPLSVEEFKEKLMLTERVVTKEAVKLCNAYKFPEALALFAIAIEKNKSTSNYISRGICYVKMRRLTEAISDFKMGENGVVSQEEQILVIESMIDFENFSVIMKDLRCIKGLTLVQYGLELCIKRDFERALQAFSAAVTKKVCEEHYLARAMYYVKIGKLDEAREDWEKAEKTKSHYNSLSNSDQIRQQLGLWRENQTIIKNVLESGLHNEDLEGKLLLTYTDFAQVGSELFDAGKYKDALYFYNGAIGLKPLPEFYKKRGDCYSKLGQEEKADSEYQLATQIEQVMNKLSNTDLGKSYKLL